jgi:hypothetical protein
MLSARPGERSKKSLARAEGKGGGNGKHEEVLRSINQPHKGYG